MARKELPSRLVTLEAVLVAEHLEEWPRLRGTQRPQRLNGREEVIGPGLIGGEDDTPARLGEVIFINPSGDAQRFHRRLPAALDLEQLRVGQLAPLGDRAQRSRIQRGREVVAAAHVDAAGAHFAGIIKLKHLIGRYAGKFVGRHKDLRVGIRWSVREIGKPTAWRLERWEPSI